MDIVSAITKRIRQLFNTENIYTEDVEQDIELPAFFIYKMESPPTRLVSNQFLISSMFNIVYMSEKGATLTHLQEMELDMLMGLEYIRVDDELIRGGDIYPQITPEGDISMTVVYPYYIRKHVHYDVVDPGEEEEAINPIDPGDKDGNIDRPDTDEGKEQELIDPDFNQEVDFMRRLDKRYGKEE